MYEIHPLFSITFKSNRIVSLLSLTKTQSEYGLGSLVCHTYRKRKAGYEVME